MLRVVLSALVIFIANAASVDFDCSIIRDNTNEPEVLWEIKKGVSKEMRFGKVCLEYACEKHFFNVGEYLIEEFYAKH